MEMFESYKYRNYKHNFVVLVLIVYIFLKLHLLNEKKVKELPNSLELLSIIFLTIGISKS